MTRVECLEARDELNEEEKVMDVVGGGEEGVGSGDESRSFIYVDALRQANLIAASDPENFLDTCGMPTCKYYLYDNLLAKVSSLLEVMRLGVSYELMEQLWAQFSLTASCANIEVC